MASGTAPRTAAAVVIMIGRKRRRQASKMASSGDQPARSRASAKSMIRMAFFLTMPISRMTPIRAISENSVWKAIRASRAPIPADGRVDSTVIGWT